MRRSFALMIGWLVAVNAWGATPELGKDALRKLVKLPTITFESTWTFDSERGFSVGSSQQDAAAEINRLRQQLKHEPADAQIHLRIGQLYFTLNDIASGQKASGLAVDCYRRLLEMQPGDAALLRGFGQALQGAGKTEEAESALRKAVAVAPKDWKARVALGRFLDSVARGKIFNNFDGNAGHLSAATVSLARRELAEAGDCFKRAVALAPKEGEVYFRRGMHRSIRATLLKQIGMAEGEPLDDLMHAESQFSETALADIKQASQLEPDNCALIGNAVLFEIYTYESRDGRINWADFSWNTLPEKSQRSIRDAETRLENLGQDPDSRQAAVALEVLGILQGPIFHEPRSAIINLRRAVALDPSRDEAWDVLASMLAHGHRYDELLSACEDRVHEKESARSHLLLAKAFEKMHDWDGSENEILESLRISPNNFTASLSEAALILRRSQDADALMDANSWLERSERLLGEVPPQMRNQQAVIELTLLRSIYFALSDQLDEARQWANAVISLDKNNPVAQDILSAMDY
ncbi:MAG TPA: tetratricopeptide repeat protein [Verrucomicrobiae bacterium]|nr:tetratricopeptide repeat protein [Verrucomicrobiae bacterium]